MKLSSLRCNSIIVLAVFYFILPCSLHASDVMGNDSGIEVPVIDEPNESDNSQAITTGRVEAQESVNALSRDIQNLKLSVITLNKDLRVLEEDLLFPANTQLNVFLSLDVGEFFTLESVKLKLDGDFVNTHIYSDKEVVALSHGGVHKLHMANLSLGEHELSAFFTGMGPSGREYKRGTTLRISKENGPKYVLLKISDSTMKLQPEFTVEQW
jgi:hypothetical protein